MTASPATPEPAAQQFPNTSPDQGDVLVARTIAALRTPEVSVAVGLAIIQAALMMRLWVGDFLNSYPYISSDGFDWITEGVAFNQLLTAEDGGAWPLLRQPVFVIVNALDNAIGVPGLMFLVVQTGAVGLTAWLIGGYARQKGSGTSVIVGLMLAWYFSVLGFWRLWVLSDTLASAVMTAGAVLALKAMEQPTPEKLAPAARLLAPAVLVASTAGLTQSYGLIPLLVIFGAHALARVASGKRRAALQPAVAAFVAAVITFGLQRVWSAIIPHQSEPTQFGLLQFSFAMAPFYFSTWTVTFGVLIPAALLAIFWKWRERTLPTLEELSLAAVVAAFAALSFFYQWPESRMTFIYLPIVMLALAAWCARPTVTTPTGQVEARAGRMLVTGCVASVVIGLLIAPGDYWKPRLSLTRFDPGATWIVTALRDGPVDRFYLQTQCQGMADFCKTAYLPNDNDPYRSMMYREYKRRILEQQH